MIERGLSFKKRFKACLKEQESSHQASDNLTACKRSKTQGQTHFYKQTLEFLEKVVAKHLS
ncbi:hypothetical protein L6505_00670 [Helicobacter pylori]|uniref:hypothetical protein n=1 Tax=Helicobacter pylori TaxID=210 RepID=UPI001EDA52A5|nr:hypothetical protein [Helicobacter pylori]UKJ10187.1 hypothetical protein L6505_00670 [Helicobacter pylori]UKJ10908.1 hypothetical protein L6503_04590 [Helicobacter pylori]